MNSSQLLTQHICFFLSSSTVICLRSQPCELALHGGVHPVKTFDMLNGCDMLEL